MSESNNIAFISDVHGNLEALTAVLEHIDASAGPAPTIYCLGDVVGYGPDPAECVDLVRERCSVTLLGNHDEALFKGALGFNGVARAAIDWTRKMLRPSLFRSQNRERWRFLEKLPLTHELGDWLLVHGSPRDPTSEYILPRDAHWPGAAKFDELFALVPSLCFVGHTHIPGIFTREPSFTSARDIEGEFRFADEEWIINVGSVGQPRDGDPRACYLSYRDGAFQFHRVEYDIEATRAKIRELPLLDDRLGDRLLEGT